MLGGYRFGDVTRSVVSGIIGDTKANGAGKADSDNQCDTGGYRFGDITRGFVSGAAGTASSAVGVVGGIASGTAGVVGNVATGTAGAIHGAVLGVDSSCFDETGPPARVVWLSNAVGRLLASASVGEATAKYFIEYTGDDVDYKVVRDMFLHEVKCEIASEDPPGDSTEPFELYANQDVPPLNVIMPGSQPVEKNAALALDAKLIHVVSVTKDLATSAGLPLKHGYVLLKYDDNTVDVTDFVADVGTEGQNFIDRDLQLRERVRIRYAPAQTPYAPCEEPLYDKISVDDDTNARQCLLSNFGLPALRRRPDSHYPIALYDMKMNEMGQPRELLTRAQVLQLIAELGGHDAHTQQRVVEADSDADRIRAAYNRAGKGGWLFVRYNNWHCNCQHYQRAIVSFLTGHDDSTANLMFRAAGYQRLCMEADGESNYIP